MSQNDAVAIRELPTGVTHFHYESGHLFVFIVENVTFN